MYRIFKVLHSPPYNSNKSHKLKHFPIRFSLRKMVKAEEKPCFLCILQLHNYHFINLLMLNEYMNTWRESVDRKQWRNDTRMQILCLTRLWLNLFANSTQYVWLGMSWKWYLLLDSIMHTVPFNGYEFQFISLAHQYSTI